MDNNLTESKAKDVVDKNKPKRKRNPMEAARDMCKEYDLTDPK